MPSYRVVFAGCGGRSAAHVQARPRFQYAGRGLLRSVGAPACTVEKPIATGVSGWRQLVELEARSATRFTVLSPVPVAAASGQVPGGGSVGDPGFSAASGFLGRHEHLRAKAPTS